MTKFVDLTSKLSKTEFRKRFGWLSIITGLAIVAVWVTSQYAYSLDGFSTCVEDPQQCDPLLFIWVIPVLGFTGLSIIGILGLLSLSTERGLYLWGRKLDDENKAD